MKNKEIIISTTDFIPGREVVEVIDIARGNTVRARNIGRDIVAGLRNIVGGEIPEYTKLLADSREHALAGWWPTLNELALMPLSTCVSSLRW